MLYTSAYTMVELSLVRSTSMTCPSVSAEEVSCEVSLLQAESPTNTKIINNRIPSFFMCLAPFPFSNQSEKTKGDHIRHHNG